MVDFLKLFFGQLLHNKVKDDKKGQSIEYFAFMFCVLIVIMIWHLVFSQQITSAAKNRCDVIPNSPNSKVANLK